MFLSITNSYLKYFLLSFLFTAFGVQTFASTELVLVAPKDVIDDYNVFIKDQNISEGINYSGPKSRRDVVEMALVQRAFLLGNVSDLKVRFRPIDSYQRILKSAQSEALVSGTSAWKQDLEKLGSQVLISDAVIKSGEFEAGFFTSPKNTKALSSTSKEQILKLVGVSSEAWTADWNSLKSKGFKQIINKPLWNQMTNMTLHQRVDFLLAPFPAGNQNEIEVDGGKLQLIPNFKIGFTDSRHFFISKSHKSAAALLKSLNEGLAQLRKSGELKRAYIESGVWNERTKDWTSI